MVPECLTVGHARRNAHEVRRGATPRRRGTRRAQAVGFLHSDAHEGRVLRRTAARPCGEDHGASFAAARLVR